MKAALAHPGPAVVITRRACVLLPEEKAKGRDNGLLQAWEVFEKVRVNADLVTLSACQTALGREVSGEGLMGFSQAFQYAGARTVLASLWNAWPASG